MIQGAAAVKCGLPLSVRGPLWAQAGVCWEQRRKGAVSRGVAGSYGSAVGHEAGQRRRLLHWASVSWMGKIGAQWDGPSTVSWWSEEQAASHLSLLRAMRAGARCVQWKGGNALEQGMLGFLTSLEASC